MKYLGHLSRKDPLYGYLGHDILSQLGVNGIPPDFRVYSIPASNHVYLYEDQGSGTRLVGKFFGGIANRSPETGLHYMEREFNNLHHLRGLGFTGYPHYVARPLGRNGSVDCVLVEEFCLGTPLAYFLATAHNRTATGDRVDFNSDCTYFDRILDQLKQWGYLGWEEAQEFYRLKDRWREKGCMWEDSQVLVHGDVTPSNIPFGEGLWVIAIDLERMKLADRVFDVGRVAGEIKHFFMQYAGDTLLRIARNS